MRQCSPEVVAPFISVEHCTDSMFIRDCVNATHNERLAPDLLCAAALMSTHAAHRGRVPLHRLYRGGIQCHVFCDTCNGDPCVYSVIRGERWIGGGGEDLNRGGARRGKVAKYCKPNKRVPFFILLVTAAATFLPCFPPLADQREPVPTVALAVTRFYRYTRDGPKKL